MKKFIKSYSWIIAIVSLLVLLGITAAYWAPPILQWFGANTEVIQGLTSFVQLVLWVGAAVIFFATQLQKKKPLTISVEKPNGDKQEIPSVITYPKNVDEARDNIEKLMRGHEYEWAVRESELYLRELFATQNKANPMILLTEAELTVDFARALIYVDRIDGENGAESYLNKVIEDIDKSYNKFLDIDGAESRVKEILGIAYNHKGYISWIKYGYYENALLMFDKATKYLGQSKDHLATTLDNMGRVYGTIGYGELAELLILKGLAIRTKTGDDYRQALSFNSLAIIELTYGNHQRAFNLADKAYQLFSRVHRKELKDIQTKKQSGARGMGLATLTKAQALRMQGIYWHEYEDLEQEENCAKLLQSAIKELEFALAIFREDTGDISEYAQARLNEESISRPVKEPVRRIQAVNEMGCAFRELTLMFRSKNLEWRSYEIKAQKYLQLSEVTSETELGHYIDTVEDFARLLFYISDSNFARVLDLIEGLQKRIEPLANDYLIIKGKSLIKLPSERCFEEIWRQLAKIHILIGQIQLRQLSSHHDRTDALSLAIKNYFVASLYLQRFSSRPLDDRNVQLYPYTSGANHYRKMLIKQLVNDLYNVLSLSSKDIQTMGEELKRHKKDYILEGLEAGTDLWLSDIKNSLGILSIMRGYS